MQPIRLGLIGTGSVVREIYQHLYFSSAYSSMLRIEAAADTDADTLAAFCDQHNIPADRRFADYREMLDKIELDAVQCNTPDTFHEQPTLDALEHDLDVMIPKPLAGTIAGAHRMMTAAHKRGRLLGVDFHKRDDPRIRQAAASHRQNAYGRFQLAVWYMLDKLLVSDPNHTPRFFASPTFASRNTPVSFLTVHMADALMWIVNLHPVSVQTTGYRHKLCSLKPVAVDGYDMCDTQITFDTGAVAHIITGWHLPNTAHATSVQSARMIFTDGMVDLALDRAGYQQITSDALAECNVLFQRRERDNSITGYGITRPGEIYRTFRQHRAGQLDRQQYEQLMTPHELGFWATVVVEAAERSLADAAVSGKSIVHGQGVDIASLLTEQLGTAARNQVIQQTSFHSE